MSSTRIFKRSLTLPHQKHLACRQPTLEHTSFGTNITITSMLVLYADNEISPITISGWILRRFGFRVTFMTGTFCLPFTRD
jgi:hypothetical protein